MLHYRAVARTNARKIGDISLAIFGVVLMLYTTALTIMSWVRASSTPPLGYCDEQKPPF